MTIDDCPEEAGAGMAEYEIGVAGFCAATAE